MRGFLKVLVVLLVAGVLAYAGVKGAMYWRVKQAMDRIVSEADGQAKVSYGGISTDLRGAATVYNIVVRSPQTGAKMRIDSMRVSTGSLQSMLFDGLWQGNATPPPNLRIDILGLHSRLDKQTFAALQRERRAEGKWGGIEQQGCAAGGLDLDPKLLKRMGFNQLTMDMHLGYSFDKQDEKLSANLAYDLYQVQSARLRLDLAGVDPADLQGAGVAGVKLARADLRLKVSRAFGQRYMAMCAAASNSTIKQFRDRLVTKVEKDLATRGLTLGAGLQQALADFYLNWGQMRLHIQPASPMGLLQLATLPQPKMLQQLGVSLFINRQQVSDLSFKLALPHLPTSLVPSPAGTASNAPPAPPPKRFLLERSFVSVPIDEIAQEVGKTVRLKPVDEPVREGVLTAVADGDAVIQQQRYGGQFSAYVSLSSIESLQVQQIKRVPQQ